MIKRDILNLLFRKVPPVACWKIFDFRCYISSLLYRIIISIIFENMKLFVKNIEESVNEVLLEAIFKQFGEVLDTKIVYDRITWESKGFGFVEFKKAEDALKAIEALNGKELVGKKLMVSEAVEKPR